MNKAELYSDIFEFIEDEKIKKSLTDDLLTILSTNINKYFLKYCFRSTLLLENLAIYYFSKCYPNEEELTYFNNQEHYKNDFFDYNFSESDIPEFSAFKIKIVMKGTNPAYPPRLQDMRAIALAT